MARASQSLFPWTPNPRQEVYCNFTPFWTCRKHGLLKLHNCPGSQSWQGTETELHRRGL